MTLSEWLADARRILAASGCPDPDIDAAWLLEDGLGLTRTQARLEKYRLLAADERERLDAMLARRAAGEPVQYITNRADFMGFRFHVDARVLIPRPDTETLAEACANFLKTCARPAKNVAPFLPLSMLDLCTGSGAIGLSVAKLCPFVRVTLADISPDALAVAQMNASSLSVPADLVQGDLFAPVSGQMFHLIASNPPYIPRGDLAGLQREVQKEPVLALDGGADGLDFYRRIAQNAPRFLLPGGAIFLEVGIYQAPDVLELLKNALCPAESGIICDLNGVERVVWARSC